MAKLPYDFYLPGSDEPAGVIAWGKSPELVEHDLAAVVGRLGGYRTLSYDQSYLLAANTLLRTAREARTLDHHALPIFYLQRHAAELLIKAPLLFGLEVTRLLEKVGKLSQSNSVVKEHNLPAYSSHSLEKLLGELSEMARTLHVGLVPDVVKAAVDEIKAVEQKKDAWSRYAISWEDKNVKNKVPRLVKHIEQEIVIPLGQIQNLLQSANDALGAIYPFDGRMMGSLGALWEGLAREAGELE